MTANTNQDAMQTDIEKAQEYLRQHSAAMQELRELGVLRSDNNPTGDYAEWLVASKLRMCLERNSTKGYDATAEQYKYQIKGRQNKTGKGPVQLGVIRNLGAAVPAFHYLIAVIFNADWVVQRAVCMTYDAVKRLAVQRTHVNGHVLQIRDRMMHEDGVEDITERLK